MVVPFSSVYSASAKACGRLKPLYTVRTISIKNRGSYNAIREETTAVFPLAQATVRGLNTIVPPQQKPTHVCAIGAVIEMIASYGAVTTDGSAIPNLTPVAGLR